MKVGKAERVQARQVGVGTRNKKGGTETRCCVRKEKHKGAQAGFRSAICHRA